MDFSSLCNSCKEQGCCTDSAVPLVFSNDFTNLKKIDRANSRFLDEKTVNGKKIKFIKKQNNSNRCVFWNSDSCRCSIYENRPFDCRAYPFDILEVDGKYHWIVYSCNPDSDWKWTEEYLTALENDPGFSEIRNNLDIFEGHTKMILPSESPKTSYVILREIK